MRSLTQCIVQSLFQIAGPSVRAGFILHPVDGPTAIDSTATEKPNFSATESCCAAFRGSQLDQHSIISTIVARNSSTSACTADRPSNGTVMQCAAPSDSASGRKTPAGVSTTSRP